MKDGITKADMSLWTNASLAPCFNDMTATKHHQTPSGSITTHMGVTESKHKSDTKMCSNWTVLSLPRQHQLCLSFLRHHRSLAFLQCTRGISIGQCSAEWGLEEDATPLLFLLAFPLKRNRDWGQLN
jgi:hypothetical protein